MRILAIIPARMGSSRFPGKPLKEILGKPMIGHVYNNIKNNNLLSDTIVATCDSEIMRYIDSINGKAIMTSNLHQRASDRCAEAITKLERNGNKYDIVVMVQGDEPMVNEGMITEALKPMLSDHNIKITNLLGKISSDEELFSKNTIKVICDSNYDAIYFSRQVIPYNKNVDYTNYYKQVCIIPFRRDFLIEYNNMKETPLEISESVDMLRIIENGLKVRMVPTKYETYPVDTLDDLKKVENLILKGK